MLLVTSYIRETPRAVSRVNKFHSQSVPVHSANCVRTCTVARRRVLSSAPLQVMGSRPLTN
jgi:hypothetical protein